MKKLLLVILLNTINKAYNAYDYDLAEYDLGLDLGGDYEDDSEFFEQVKRSRSENVKISKNEQVKKSRSKNVKVSKNERKKKSRSENVKISKNDGGSCNFYDFNGGFFRKAKRKDMFCEGGFCMPKEKLVLVRKRSKLDNHYRAVLMNHVISQCAPSLGVKVKNNSFSSNLI